MLLHDGSPSFWKGIHVIFQKVSHCFGPPTDTVPLLQDVLLKVVRYEGFFSLWKGFTPYYARLGPHTVLTFIFLEQMNKWYQRLFLSA